jgi:hypothetical protein
MKVKSNLGRRLFARFGVVGVVAALLVCISAAIVLAAQPFGASRSSAPVLSIKPTRGSATVVAGAAAKYTLKIKPGNKRIKLTATGMPSGTRVAFKTKLSKTKTRAATSTVTVTTAATTPGGAYTIRLKGKAGTASGRATLRLTVTTPTSAAPPAPAAPTAPTTEPPPSARVFVAAGAVATPLAPGVPQKLDLSIQNLTAVDMTLQGLTVKFQSIQAPQATPSTPCTAADFSFSQMSGAAAITIPPGSSRKLSELGFAPNALPAVEMLDRTSNQDGCQNAFLSIDVEGTASGAKWVGAGSGAVNALIGSAQQASLVSAAPSGQLAPGGAVKVNVTVTNPNPFAVHVNSLVLDTGSGNGGFDVDAAHTACTVTSLSFARQSNGGLGWQIPPRVGATDGSLFIEMPAALSMAANAPDACQGAFFTVHLKGGN